MWQPPSGGSDDYDAVVVGAGFGGLYAVHRLARSGLSVRGFESAADVGGVWWHNRYPGARVDVDSLDYCYYFSAELFSAWKWTERYASQEELLRYLQHAADRFDIRKSFTFNTRIVGAQWLPERRRYRVTTSAGDTLTCRFLVMTTGNLSAARKPEFPGLDEFRGDWVQTSHWPDYPVEYTGRRVAVIGTGSSGLQTIPVVAETAGHVCVFQRTPNYCVPAQNGPLDDALWHELRGDLTGARAQLFSRPAGTRVPRGKRRVSEYSAAGRMAAMEAQWNYGGQGFNLIFADQTTNQEANDYAAEFVRMKIRERVKDPGVAEALCPSDHPIGSRRLCLDTNYYETYNRDNVTLVNVRAEPIERITSSGIRTAGQHYEADLIIFALGFHAFTGALDSAGIRNDRGVALSDRWKRGPRTYLGLMTAGFPNLFTITGPGSPSVLANMALANEQHIDFVAECIEYMASAGFATVEPTPEAEDSWTQHVADCASPLLRLKVRNYMVHVNADDQSRVFIPYAGGFDRYAQRCREIAERGFAGFAFA